MKSTFIVHELGTNNLNSMINVFNKFQNKKGYLFTLFSLLKPFISENTKYPLTLDINHNVNVAKESINKFNKHERHKTLCISNAKVYLLKEVKIL